MVDITERLRLNEDDWLFGNTARTARKEIIKLRGFLKVVEEALEKARIELIETGTCTETLDEALTKIREMK